MGRQTSYPIIGFVRHTHAHRQSHVKLDLRDSHRKKLRVTVYVRAQRHAVTGKRTPRRDYTHCAHGDARANRHALTLP